MPFSASWRATKSTSDCSSASVGNCAPRACRREADRNLRALLGLVGQPRLEAARSPPRRARARAPLGWSSSLISAKLPPPPPPPPPPPSVWPWPAKAVCVGRADAGPPRRWKPSRRRPRRVDVILRARVGRRRRRQHAAGDDEDRPVVADEAVDHRLEVLNRDRLAGKLSIELSLYHDPPRLRMQYQCASLLRTKPCCVTGVLSANLLSGWRVSSSVRPQTCCSAFESTCTEKLPGVDVARRLREEGARLRRVRPLREHQLPLLAVELVRDLGEHALVEHVALHQVVQAVLAAGRPPAARSRGSAFRACDSSAEAGCVGGGALGVLFGVESGERGVGGGALAFVARGTGDARLAGGHRHVAHFAVGVGRGRRLARHRGAVVSATDPLEQSRSSAPTRASAS